MNRHEKQFEKGSQDLDKANRALDDNEILKGLFYGTKGLVIPVLGVLKDPKGFIKELIND